MSGHVTRARDKSVDVISRDDDGEREVKETRRCATSPPKTVRHEQLAIRVSVRAESARGGGVTRCHVMADEADGQKEAEANGKEADSTIAGDSKMGDGVADDALAVQSEVKKASGKAAATGGNRVELDSPADAEKLCVVCMEHEKNATIVRGF